MQVKRRLWCLALIPLHIAMVKVKSAADLWCVDMLMVKTTTWELKWRRGSFAILWSGFVTLKILHRPTSHPNEKTESYIAMNVRSSLQTFKWIQFLLLPSDLWIWVPWNQHLEGSAVKPLVLRLRPKCCLPFHWWYPGSVDFLHCKASAARLRLQIPNCFV